MLTQEDLQQIGKLLEGEREHTRKLVRDEIAGSEKRLAEKIDTVDMKVEALNMKVEAFHTEQRGANTEILDIIDSMTNPIEERVKKIEEHIGLSPKM